MAYCNKQTKVGELINVLESKVQERRFETPTVGRDSGKRDIVGDSEQRAIEEGWVRNGRKPKRGFSSTMESMEGMESKDVRTRSTRPVAF
ncbi:hypothetical protein PAAG_11926 [Paracoccidioides lutzii Pb01]|uniref:Uncharacterized protein n=1 Tax=Paracoccidioides lutzii (strain ATCC MYA-826 / Pb01) TaxID=502779 RepID=A0A0A2VKC9_PARBA|nr:hypothetical protein PAAG_11926 [Paracoccidioides lutzii Pb01]KGQ01349.1 hypothetical protein PAAG_11926 [Paracoccidioides lutzii Pb01]